VFLLDYDTTKLLPRVMWDVTRFNVLLFVFNLVPIPPLDGSRILAWVLPSGLRPAYVRLERVGMLAIVLLLLYVPAFQAAVLGGIDATIDLLDLVTVKRW